MHTTDVLHPKPDALGPCRAFRGFPAHRHANEKAKEDIAECSASLNLINLLQGTYEILVFRLHPCLRMALGASAGDKIAARRNFTP